MTVKEVIAEELEKLRKALETSRKGADREPEDGEWELMIQLYSEAVAAVERIEVAANAQ